MFNNRLREMRMKRNLTQKQVADSIGVALRTYQCYETGTRQPDFEKLVNLANTLDVSIDYLLCRDDFMKSHEVFSGES